MKKLYLLLIFIALTGFGYGQTTINNVTFESAGGYSTSVTEFTDGSYDFFTRTNGSNIGSGYVVENVQGTYYFAVEDTDGDGNPTNLNLIIDDIDISGYTTLQLKVFLAEDDSGDGDQDWDAATWVHFSYDIDNTESFTNLLWVEAEGGTNTVPKIDTDFNGLGDGTEITSSFVQFTVDISGTGSLLDLKVEFNNLKSGDEDIAIDNIEIVGIAAGGVLNPSSFTTTTYSTTQINLSWAQNGNNNDVMVAWSSNGTFGTPTDGTSYSATDAISGGGTILYNGSSTSYNHTSLTANTQYYYKVWSVDGSDNYSSGVTGDTTTYKDEPSNHVSTFAAGTPTSSTIPLTWGDNDGVVIADGYLIKASTSSTFSDPVDQTSIDDDTDMLDGSGVMNVVHGNEAYTFSGLTESTQYFFKIWSYTNSGNNIDYKTDGTVPTDNETTAAPPPKIIVARNCDPQSNYAADRFAEIYNAGNTTVDLSGWTLDNVQTGSVSFTWNLTGNINPGETKICGNANGSGQTINPDFTATWSGNSWNGKGGDGTILKDDGSVIIDNAVQSDGTGKFENGQMKRKLNISSPVSTYNADEWVFVSVSNANDVIPGFHGTVWTGGSTVWSTESNWDNEVPTSSYDAFIPQSASNYPTITASATCNNLTIESNVSGDGSLMGQSYLTVSGTTIVERYTTAGKWHGISSPVSGADFNSLYLNGSPDVWGKSYNELDNTYTSATSLSTPLGDMKGWMVWIGGSSAQTFDLTGSLRSGTIGSSNNLTNQAVNADHGYNFVGNPFPSAIDWDAASGWTKTDISDGFWILDDANDRFATYSSGSGGLNGGTKYISSGQAFFVQVDAAESLGTLQMTDAVQVHDEVGFIKEQNVISNFIKLKVSDDSSYDESIIRLDSEATEGFDSNLDMHKMFSYNEDLPQLFSTANENMSINVLPFETVNVPMDVIGKDGNEMKISIAESNDFDQIFLSDDYLGTQTNLMETSYSFIYDASQKDRFTIYFTVVGMEDNILEDIKIYSYNKKIKVEIPLEIDGQIQIVNLMGQIIKEVSARSGSQEISIEKTGYYLVRIIGNNRSISRKVFIQ